jgi:hypothetical protein
VEAGFALEPLAGEAGGGERSGGGVDAAEGARRARTAFQWKDVSAERPSTPARAGVAVQTFTPVELVANTGLPMRSARMKYTTPPSMTATGSQPFQTYSRISAPEVSLAGKTLHWSVF